MELNKIYQGNSLDVLKTFKDESIDCCITSPPYWGLRDYGVDGQLGLEETPEKYVQNIVEIFEEVRRVLKKSGTLWLNLGDTYSSTKTGNTEVNKNPKLVNNSFKKQKPKNLKSKDLIGIPWMVAFALRSSGWYLRQDIIWSKPNPMPESVTDRCTKSHEYIFLLSKSAKYYYDHEAIKTPLKESSINRLNQDIENQEGSDRVPGKENGKMKACRPHGIVRDRLLDYDSKEKILRDNVKRGGFNYEKDIDLPEAMANKKSVWTIPTMPFKEAHFATFPQKLIYDCVKSGCPEDGVVLDPFMGAGTTAIVARKLYRNYIGIDLNSEYIEIAERRIHKELGFFK